MTLALALALALTLALALPCIEKAGAVEKFLTNFWEGTARMSAC